MRILVACEESQAVTIELRKRGHEAYSCDIIECSGGHPEWHIQADALQVINPQWYDGMWGITPSISFYTADGDYHQFDSKWDMIIAFPPCTYLTVTGNRWFNVEQYGRKAMERIEARERAAEFFMAFANADCPLIAIENPIGVMSNRFRRPDQIIQPWQFALSDEERIEKSTCIWLKGLPPLEPMFDTKPEMAYHKWTTPDGRQKRQTMWYYKTRCLPHSERARAASKTFPGIARAFAEQWTPDLFKE